MNQIDKYWLAILPHVYYNKTSDAAILYNTENGNFIKTSNIEFIELIDSMHLHINLGVILIDCSKLSIKIKAYIEDAIRKNIFMLYDFLINSVKPIQLMPILNLQQDISRGQNNFSGKYISDNLLNMFIQLNGQCTLNCPNCNDYFKQHVYCSKNNDNEMDKSLLLMMLNQLPTSSLLKLCFFGGDIFLYTNLNFLLGYLNDNNICSIFFTYYLNIRFTQWGKFKNHFLEILYSQPIVKGWFDDNKKLLLKDNIKHSFIITSENDYDEIDGIIEKYKLKNYSIIPFYNGLNKDFFEKYIYINQMDILACDTEKQRYIFARQKLNTNFFGTLFVLQNGDAKSNVLMENIGNIKESNLLKIIKNELITNSSWRLIRDIPPCNDCLYQFICPSPSNYEFVIGKNNLCHIK